MYKRQELEAPIVAKLSEAEVSDLSLQEPDKEIPLIVEQEQSDYHEKVAQREREFLESEEPVSYTHLDVYKRQVLMARKAVFRTEKIFRLSNAIFLM